MEHKQTAYLKLIEDLEHWTRKAMHEKVNHALDELTLSKIPRPLLFKFAQIAQRNSRPELALGILNSVVRGKLSEISPAEDFEILVYANSLNQMERNDEAWELLKKLDAKKDPNIDFSMAMSLVGSWKYRESIDHLKRFIRSPQTAPYQKAVAKINLLSGYIQMLNLEEAFQLSSEVKAELEAEHFSLLQGNAYELRAQIQFLRRDYQESLKSLKRAEELIGATNGIYLVFVRKWQFLTRIFLNQNWTPQLNQELKALQKRARELNLWEVLRDTDFFLAIQQNDSDRILGVLAATPNLFYKNRARKICKMFGVSLSPATHNQFVYKSLDRFSEEHQVETHIELQDEQLRTLAKSPAMFELLKCLLEDSYRPCGLAKLAGRLYPDIKFEPKMVTRRAQTIVNRLNQYFKENNLQMRVRTEGFEFFLESVDKASIKVIVNSYWMEENLIYGLARSFFKGRRFTVDDFQMVSGLSKISAKRELNALVNSGFLSKQKLGSSWSYFLSNFRHS